MEEREKHLLIKKYLTGQISQEEKEKVDQWFSASQEENLFWESQDDEETVKDRIHQAILNNIEAPSKVKRFFKWKTFTAAASVILVATLAYVFYPKTSSYKTIAKTETNQVENRHILLSDSSIIVLRPGSELLVSEDFGEKVRKVELKGEAYFDIKANAQKPFIITTGKIKTTVLGTAFSIKALPNEKEVEVKVEHGKVRVENETTVLGILQASQQLIAKGTTYQEKEIKNISQSSQQEFSWKDEDVRFDGVSFGDIAKKLEKRYNVKIDFKNIELQSCKMSGAYLGTDMLTEILENLCITSRTKFVKVGDDAYEIWGEKCF